MKNKKFIFLETAKSYTLIALGAFEAKDQTTVDRYASSAQEQILKFKSFVDQDETREIIYKEAA